LQDQGTIVPQFAGIPSASSVRQSGRADAAGPWKGRIASRPRRAFLDDFVKNGVQLATGNSVRIGITATKGMI